MRRLAEIAALLILAAAATRGQENTTQRDGTTMATSDHAIDVGSTTSLDDEQSFIGEEGKQETSTVEVENDTSTMSEKSTTTSVDGDGTKTTGTVDEMSSKTPINGTGKNSTGEITGKITEEERQEMVDKHNEYRKKHNASPLELDDEASIMYN